MRISRTPAVAAFAVASVLALAGCGDSEPAADTDTAITFGRLNPTTADYDFAPTSPQLQSYQGWAVYDFLIGWAETEGRLEFEPALATEWEFSPDTTGITLQLRDDVVFSDGTPLDAEAVGANIDHHLDGGLGAFTSIGATGYEVTGSHEITIELDTELDRLTIMQNLASTVIASPAAFDDPDTLATMPAGSGPYVLDEERTTSGVEYTFVRNDEYWNPEAYPYDTVVVKEFADAVAAANALKSGQVDFAQIDANSAADVEGSGFALYPSTGFWTGLYIGDRDGTLVPALGDVRVRQAMNHAFDRETIATTVGQGYARPGHQPFVSTQYEYQEGREDEFAYDPDRARELLAEAGYPDGFDLTLPTSGSPYDPIIVQSLGDIGIRVTLEPIEVSDTLERWQAGTDPVLDIQQRYVNTAAFFIQPGGIMSRNVPDHVVELLELRNSGEGDEAAAAAAELGKVVMDEVWFVVVAQPDIMFAGIEGLDIEPNNVSGLAPLLPNIGPAA